MKGLGSPAIVIEFKIALDDPPGPVIFKVTSVPGIAPDGFPGGITSIHELSITTVAIAVSHTVLSTSKHIVYSTL